MVIRNYRICIYVKNYKCIVSLLYKVKTLFIYKWFSHHSVNKKYSIKRNLFIFIKYLVAVKKYFLTINKCNFRLKKLFIQRMN